MTPNIESLKFALESLHPEQAYLFGSHALQEADEESDLDLIVVLPSPKESLDFQERIEWIQRIRSVIREAGIEKSLDILVYSLPQWEQFLLQGSQFSRNLQKHSLRIA